MFESKNVGGLRKVLSRMMKSYADLTVEFTKQIDLDIEFGNKEGYVTFAHQTNWLGWHSTELAVQGVAANEACALVYALKNLKDEDEVPTKIKSEALRNVLADMKLSSRSTSPASNLAEDAKRAFWVEIGTLILS